MNVVLTCLQHFQPCILINLQQLIRLGHEHIYVITHRHLREKFTLKHESIRLLFLEDVPPEEGRPFASELDATFRHGFWLHTSYRFFAIRDCMRAYDIQDVIHLENDVLVYYHCDTLLPCLDKRFVYMPFDSLERNIASIVYIPDYHVLDRILRYYNPAKDDMHNFRDIQQKTNQIDHFPICFPETNNPLRQFVTKNYDRFGGVLFDAAAMGQYIGGVDPDNHPHTSTSTVGFVNETCVVKYNQYRFVWITSPCLKTLEDVKRPFLFHKGRKYPIFNLHIHSKQLAHFI